MVGTEAAGGTEAADFAALAIADVSERSEAGVSERSEAGVLDRNEAGVSECAVVVIRTRVTVSAGASAG